MLGKFAMHILARPLLELNFTGFAHLALCSLGKTNSWLKRCSQFTYNEIFIKKWWRKQWKSILPKPSCFWWPDHVLQQPHWTMFLNITLRNLISFHLITIIFLLVDGYRDTVSILELHSDRLLIHLTSGWSQSCLYTVMNHLHTPGVAW